MIVADYIVDYLVKQGVTDAFGLPGAVVLDFIYAMDHNTGITPHLCYHEQGAGFAAVGYAQAGGKLGVAYATRGPGFTNLITPIADAWCDSVPVLFITAHTSPHTPYRMRLEVNQEIDTCVMVRNVTKYAARIDKIEDVQRCVEKACYEALNGRKGPVLLDIAAALWEQEIALTTLNRVDGYTTVCDNGMLQTVETHIFNAKRPILLIGDGIHQAKVEDKVTRLAKKWNIPVLSSRYAHDINALDNLYYGYIGSFGLRYANFILSKADLVICLGNRLNFPIDSKSYASIPDNAIFIRFDIDESEFDRTIPNAKNYHIDLSKLLDNCLGKEWNIGSHIQWIDVCNIIRERLWDNDIEDTQKKIAGILRNEDLDSIVVNDVGYNEFWVSQACVYAKYKGRVIYSKSFATLGCSLPKAIGAHYSTRKPVICFTGDQGFQLNVQELQVIAQNKLPIKIVVINNGISGMIRDKEEKKYGKYLHSTKDSGYLYPNLKNLSNAFGLNYAKIYCSTHQLPISGIFELIIDSDEKLKPYLPLGRHAQDMEPRMNDLLYNEINRL